MLCSLFLFDLYEKLMAMHVLAAIQWVPEDRVTLFTTEGLVQIGGSVIPRRISSSDVCHLLILNYHTT